MDNNIEIIRYILLNQFLPPFSGMVTNIDVGYWKMHENVYHNKIYHINIKLISGHIIPDVINSVKYWLGMVGISYIDCYVEVSRDGELCHIQFPDNW